MDLTGQWSGDFTLIEAGRLIKFITKALPTILQAMGFGVLDTLEGVPSNFVLIEGLGVPIFMQLNFASMIRVSKVSFSNIHTTYSLQLNHPEPYVV